MRFTVAKAYDAKTLGACGLAAVQRGTSYTEGGGVAVKGGIVFAKESDAHIQAAIMGPEYSVYRVDVNDVDLWWDHEDDAYRLKKATRMLPLTEAKS